MTRAAVLKAKCPTCLAEPGQNCVRQNGSRRWSLHVDRWAESRKPSAPARPPLPEGMVLDEWTYYDQQTAQWRTSKRPRMPRSVQPSAPTKRAPTCEGCGAPLTAHMTHCEYCRRPA